jgi:repressor of nif and glnA expression
MNMETTIDKILIKQGIDRMARFGGYLEGNVFRKLISTSIMA